MVNSENAAGVGLSVLILLSVPTIFQTFLPPAAEITKEKPGSTYSSRLRKSEVYATVISVGLGFAGSMITNTPWPFMGAAAIAAAIIVHYEGCLRYDMGEVC